MLKKIISILVVVAGIVVIVMGAGVSSAFSGTAEKHSLSPAKISYYSDAEKATGGSYSVSSASFGGDFYTYIYKSNRTIVDELDDILKASATAANNLNEIDHALETVVKAENEIYLATLANIEATDAINNNILKMEAGYAKNAGLLIMAIGILIMVIGLLALADAFTKNKPQLVEAEPAAKCPSASEERIEEPIPELTEDEATEE